MHDFFFMQTLDTFDNLRKNFPNLQLVQFALLSIHIYAEVLVFASLHDNIELVLPLILLDVRHDVWVRQTFHDCRLFARCNFLFIKHIFIIMLLDDVCLAIFHRCDLVY